MAALRGAMTVSEGRSSRKNLSPRLYAGLQHYAARKEVEPKSTERDLDESLGCVLRAKQQAMGVDNRR